MKKRMLTVILILTIVMNIPSVVSAKELQSPSYYLNKIFNNRHLVFNVKC